MVPVLSTGIKGHHRASSQSHPDKKFWGKKAEGKQAMWEGVSLCEVYHLGGAIARALRNQRRADASEL